MQRKFPNDDASERAYIILSSMDLSMVRDIQRLFDRNGNQVFAMLASDAAASTGIPRPLAAMSGQYFPNIEDFYYVAIGYFTVMLDAFNGGGENMKGRSAKDYADILNNVYHLPGNLATNISQKIETYDIIGGPKGSATDAKTAWYKSILSSSGEILRRTVNYSVGLLNVPWRMEETQDYDVDALYELKGLGKAVEELASRTRLMTAQAMIQTSMSSGSAGFAVGDPDFGDPLSDLISLLSPVLGRVIPRGMLGGGASIRDYGDHQTATQLKQLHSANASADEGDPAYGELDAAIETGDISTPTAIRLSAKDNPQIQRLLEHYDGLRGYAADKKATHDYLTETLGDVVADTWSRGDIAGLYEELGDIMSCETTGDPALDAALIEETTGDIMNEGGDVEDMGGLFTKLRTKNKLRKAKRRQRKALKHAHLDAAKDLANRDYTIDAADYTAQDPTYQWNGYGDQGQQGGYVDDGTSVIDMSQI